MTVITDEFMMGMLSKTKAYTLVLLKSGPNNQHPEMKSLIWEHVRRNFTLREEGLLSVVTPVSDETDLKGMGIFNADIEQTRQLMEQDPCVQAGIFTFEIHPTRSFPGDLLPA
ncbi:MAG: hypothetical protein ACM3PR_10710 [Bacteroidales bacterium]